MFRFYAHLILAILYPSVGVANDSALPTASTVTQSSFVFVDSRPKSDKKARAASLNIMSCSYGIYSLADKITSPSRIELLRIDLNKLLSDKLAGRNVTVLRYALYKNDLGTTRAMVNRSQPGILADISNDRATKCTQEKTGEGWVTATELTTNIQPIVIFITLRIDGKDYSIRYVQSPARAFDSYMDSEGSAFLMDAIQKANSAIAKIVSDELTTQSS